MSKMNEQHYLEVARRPGFRSAIGDEHCSVCTSAYPEDCALACPYTTALITQDTLHTTEGKSQMTFVTNTTKRETTKPLFTKRHYTWLARFISEQHHLPDRFVQNLIDEFREDNPNFDSVKFQETCNRTPST